MFSFLLTETLFRVEKMLTFLRLCFHHSVFLAIETLRLCSQRYLTRSLFQVKKMLTLPLSLIITAIITISIDPSFFHHCKLDCAGFHSCHCPPEVGQVGAPTRQRNRNVYLTDSRYLAYIPGLHDFFFLLLQWALHRHG